MNQKLAETLYEQKVRTFSKLMIEKLEAKQYENNDNWDICSTAYLVKRLHEEITEVMDMLDQKPPRYAASRWHSWYHQFTRECADVANFSMMIADMLGNLKVER